MMQGYHAASRARNAVLFTRGPIEDWRDAVSMGAVLASLPAQRKHVIAAAVAALALLFSFAGSPAGHARSFDDLAGPAIVNVASLPATSLAADAASAPVERTLPEPQRITIHAVPESTMAVAMDRDSYSAISWAELHPILWPFPESSISSGYGARAGCSAGCSTDHKGADFIQEAGTPIPVIAEGVVSTVSHGNGGYGTFVTVDHVVGGLVFTTLYGHMTAGSPTVRPGQQVQAGQTIGLVGSTGTSTANHLHFEVQLGGVAVNPISWLHMNAR